MQLSEEEYHFLSIFPKDRSTIDLDEIVVKIAPFYMNPDDAKKLLTYFRDKFAIEQDKSKRMTFIINERGLALIRDYEAAIAKEVREEKMKARESWPKRNWILIAVVAYVFGILSSIIVEYSKRKIWPESSQPIQAIPIDADTLKNR